jgi:hypothetical protein
MRRVNRLQANPLFAGVIDDVQRPATDLLVEPTLLRVAGGRRAVGFVRHGWAVPHPCEKQARGTRGSLWPTGSDNPGSPSNPGWASTTPYRTVAAPVVERALIAATVLWRVRDGQAPP